MPGLITTLCSHRRSVVSFAHHKYVKHCLLAFIDIFGSKVNISHIFTESQVLNKSGGERKKARTPRSVKVLTFEAAKQFLSFLKKVFLLPNKLGWKIENTCTFYKRNVSFTALDNCRNNKSDRLFVPSEKVYLLTQLLILRQDLLLLISAETLTSSAAGTVEAEGMFPCHTMKGIYIWL